MSSSCSGCILLLLRASSTNERECAFGTESLGLNLLYNVVPNLLESGLFKLLDLSGWDEVHSKRSKSFGADSFLGLSLFSLIIMKTNYGCCYYSLSIKYSSNFSL